MILDFLFKFWPVKDVSASLRPMAIVLKYLTDKFQTQKLGKDEATHVSGFTMVCALFFLFPKNSFWHLVLEMLVSLEKIPEQLDYLFPRFLL